jgi:hypothetical protein
MHTSEDDMAEKTVVALYDDCAAATRAVRSLEESGIDPHRISVVANDVEGGLAGGHHAGSVGGDAATAAPEGAGTGAALGALLGGGASLLAAAGALAIPGIGPALAAGPLAAALAGAGIGAAAGGLIGGLVGLGVPEEDAKQYAEGVRRGGALVTVHVGDGMAEQAMRILENYGPANLDQRSGIWRKEGWQGFDEGQEGWSAERIERERAQWRVKADDRAAATEAGAGTQRGSRSRLGEEIREAREGSTIEAEASTAEMEGGPLPSAMSGMFGSAGAGSDPRADRPGIGATPEGGEGLKPQDEPLKRHADPTRQRVRAYGQGDRTLDRAAAGDKPTAVEGSDPLAGHSRDRR